LIIWDEAPMCHRHAFEALDKSMWYILRFSNEERANLPFGGKVVVLGGDFCQILPVVPKRNSTRNYLCYYQFFICVASL
jgi:ATP-dependent DNA helicase PIF1